MKTLFSVYDRKTQSYGMIMTHHSDGDAIRAFEMACQNPETLFHKYPEDFTLTRFGKFDDDTGIIELEEHPVPVYTHSKPVKQNEGVSNEISNATSVQSSS